MNFYEWTGGASEEEIEALIQITKKSYMKWLLISLIPIINIFTMGNAIFCYNNLSYLKSRGRSNGNGLWRLILLVYGLFIPPLIGVQLCSRFEKLGNKVLGWN